LPLYRRVGDVLGEANCIRSLGDLALGHSDHAAAQARYEEALPLYCRIGHILGEANSISSLGDIALECCDPDTAEARYEEALLLYRRIGDILGEANCILALGDVAVMQTLLTKAFEKFVESLQLFEMIEEPYSIGSAHLRLARLALDFETREKHLQAAREAWTQIDRADLIDQLEQEFNPSEKQ
jgi:tetratricopeptide (TPR) repeat protein